MDREQYLDSEAQQSKQGDNRAGGGGRESRGHFTYQVELLDSIHDFKIFVRERIVRCLPLFALAFSLLVIVLVSAVAFDGRCERQDWKVAPTKKATS